MDRVLGAARMYLVNPKVPFGVPWLIVGTSFAINVSVWALLDAGQQPWKQTTGGLSALSIAVLVVFAQSATWLLPFAMAISLSRRAFSTWDRAHRRRAGPRLRPPPHRARAGREIHRRLAGGSLLLRARPRRRRQPRSAGPGLRRPMFLAATLGAAAGTAYKHWGAMGVYSLSIGVLLVAGGLVVLITWQRWWAEIRQWFLTGSMAVIAVALPLAAALVVGALAYTTLRRVVP